MNAKEFIKQHGWAAAREAVRQSLNRGEENPHELTVAITVGGRRVYSRRQSDKFASLQELYELLCYRELVMDFGGLERARKYSTDPFKAPEVREALTIAVREVEAVGL